MEITMPKDQSGRTAAQPPSSKRELIPILVMMVGSFTAILNQTLMTSALPHLMAEFSITSNTAQWLTTAFMLTNGIMIPITAFLIQRFTTRQLFFYAIGMFLFGTIVCTAAPVSGAAARPHPAGHRRRHPHAAAAAVLFVVFPPTSAAPRWAGSAWSSRSRRRWARPCPV